MVGSRVNRCAQRDILRYYYMVCAVSGAAPFRQEARFREMSEELAEQAKFNHEQWGTGGNGRAVPRCARADESGAPLG